MKRFLRRLRRRRDLDRDLEDELRFHLEMKALETGDALEARKQVGNIGAFKEACREMWAFSSLESWSQDLRYATRTLWNQPGVTLVAVLALALGIGANTTVFTVVSSALSFDMHVDHVERLVIVSIRAEHVNDFAQSVIDFQELRSQVKSIENLAAYRFVPVNVSDRSSLPERFNCVQMSVSGFAVAGARAAMGRSFQAEDERAGAAPVLMLSDRVWQDRYGKDPGIIGRMVRVDDVPRVVIGVMPPGMRFPEDTDVWAPLIPLGVSDLRSVMLFGRLAGGVKIAAARAEVDAIARGLAAKHPEQGRGLVADVQPFLEVIGVYHARPMLYALFCAVAFVLLIACADVANLLLARAAARSREISIRIAIGAGRMRIIRQLLVESVVLSITGGFFGWLVALSGLRWFDAATSKGPRPSWIDFSMNTRVLVYLMAVSIGTGILFGLAPALRLAKVDVNDAIKDGGRGAAGGIRGRYLASLLVAFEMAMCVVLLVGAGLLIRSSVKLYNAPMGVNSANVLTMHINLPEAKYRRSRDLTAFHGRLRSRLESLPGVETVGLSSNLPFTFPMNLPVELEGNPEVVAGLGLVVSADYFRVMQVRARRGRVLSDLDADSAEVVVNESFANKYWSGADPLGKHLRLVRGTAFPWLTVVGVVPDIQQDFHRPLEMDPLIYLPYAADPQRVMFLVARTFVPPESLTAAFRKEVQNLDENLPVYDVLTLESRIAQNRLNVGSFGILLTIFGTIALVLASVGLYAVTAHAVSQRTQEIGIRMVMGGTPRDILGLVLRQGLRPIIWGLIVGLPLAFASTRVLRMALVGVSPGDPVTFAGVIVVLTVAGVLGCAIPGRRAVRIDPVVALRSE